MSQTQFKNTVFDCTMDAPGNGVPTNSQDARDFLDAIALLHKAIPLTRFDLDKDPVEPDTYSYEFEAADGRKWKQALRAPAGQEEEMTFNTTGDFWKKSEFVPHREVRDRTVALIKVYGCFDIRCRW